MLRRAVVELTGRGNSEISFARTGRGRPFPMNVAGVEMNVSHAGDLTVLAADLVRQEDAAADLVRQEGAATKSPMLGIDVMPVTDRRVERTEEFFRLMRRQFTDSEWEKIRSEPSEELQLRSFFRHWCLKESYVKAVGTGLNLDLRTIQFNIQTDLTPHTSVNNTKVSLSGVEDPTWRFWESDLSNHLVSVASNINQLQGQEWRKMNIEDLLAVLQPANNCDNEEDWRKFSSRSPTKPF